MFHQKGNVFEHRDSNQSEISQQTAIGIHAFRACNSRGMRNQSDFARYTPVPGVDKRSGLSRRGMHIGLQRGVVSPMRISPPQMAN